VLCDEVERGPEYLYLYELRVPVRAVGAVGGAV